MKSSSENDHYKEYCSCTWELITLQVIFLSVGQVSQSLSFKSKPSYLNSIIKSLAPSN